MPLQAMTGGVQTPAGVVIPLDDAAQVATGPYSTVGAPVRSSFNPPFVSSMPVGTGGGTFSGGGGTSDLEKRHFEPKQLKFPAKK